jgi:hypothetical protein
MRTVPNVRLKRADRTLFAERGQPDRIAIILAAIFVRFSAAKAVSPTFVRERSIDR